MYLFSKDFWVYSFERMIKTAAQSALAALTAETFNMFQTNSWWNVAAFAGLGAVYSILTSLSSYSAAAKVTSEVEDVKAIAEMVRSSTASAQPVQDNQARG